MRRSPYRSLVLLGFVVLAGCSSADEASNIGGQEEAVVDTGSTETSAETTTDSAENGPSDQPLSAAPGRADITEQGNRVAEGRGSLTTVAPIDVPVTATPLWVLPIAGPEVTAANEQSRWLVVLDDDTTVIVDEAGTVVAAEPYTAPLPPDRFADPLPDGRVVTFEDIEVALVGPTDRYPHGVLGDRLEAAAIEVRSTDGRSSIEFGPDAPTVIEGLSPMLGDLDLDGTPEILVTHSNADVGAWLAVWSLDGELLAQSDPIGQGNRWRNQLAIAPVGPGGEVEVIDVRTPHLGGTVEYFQLDGDQLIRVATQTGYTSHQIGSRNLDLGIVADANGDGTLNVVVPTDDRRMLGVLRRTTDGVAVEADLDLPGRLTTNVSAQQVNEGRLAFAVGTNDQVIRIWPGS